VPVTIIIPTALRVFTDRKKEFEANGSTVGDAILDFAAAYPDIKTHLFDDNGELRSFLNIYLGETNIRNIDGIKTPIKDGDTLMLVPAIAGGCDRRA
jgi:adenylyltransferase/sulfurtransferase